MFTVFPPRSVGEFSSPFALIGDRWDDFGFKTQYALHRRVSEGESYIGDVKILKRGQQPSPSGLLPNGPLERLGDDFCSLGGSLDYYERVGELPSDEGGQLLRALRDVIALPELVGQFEQEEGWRTSILRFVDNPTEFFQLARVLLSRDYASLPAVSADISFTVAGWLVPLVLQFAAPAGDMFTNYRPTGGAATRYSLPQRITVLTGRNGSGKSTVLARLARVLHGSQRDRSQDPLLSLGALDPIGVGFTRIITVSYSAFDAFQVPGMSREERLQIARDMQEGTGRYYFCGLRDIARENEIVITDDIPVFPGDRQPHTMLKSLTELSQEFARNISQIKERGRDALLSGAAMLLLADPSFNDLERTDGMVGLLTESPGRAFLTWSTGHKIVMHTLSSIVAQTEPKSILLFDEPESHLHPPLLAALMHGIRYVLEEKDAFAVIATHSPVVVQETLARHVNIIRRQGAETTIFRPTIETFGESIGAITDEVFGLNSQATDYHEILKRLAQGHRNVEGVEELFDHGLSTQARAYVMSLLASQRREG